MTLANNGTYTAPAGATTASAGVTIASATWNSIFTDIQTALTSIGQGFSSVPVTLTGTSGSMLATHGTLIINSSGPFTLTLLGASSYTGKKVYITTVASNAVTSASSNVVPAGSITPGTAILPATAGRWVLLQSDGSNWITIAHNS